MDDGSRAGFLKRLFKPRTEETVEDEIVSILNEGQDQGIILESEAEMITNIFELDDIDASEIMTHRKNLSAVDSSSTLQEAMEYIVKENYSRFPVYDENIDNITGILHIKDAIRYYLVEANRDLKLKDIPGILQKARYIPETSKLNSIFKNMQADKIHMQVVVDEYGQTAGIVCMEDILEEIVGNIFDEHDEVEVNIVDASSGVYIIKGLTPLSEIEEETGITYSDEENDTLNGFLISIMDRIPEDDEGLVIEHEGVRYKILSVEDKTIALVRVEIINNNE
ncbi:MAG: HlyC/CorC family transporter [Parasporobacterium sp.]|nr:HlyC/CorC family transporter [Parasporobacterium sp.]